MCVDGVPRKVGVGYLLWLIGCLPATVVSCPDHYELRSAEFVSSKPPSSVLTSVLLRYSFASQGSEIAFMATYTLKRCAT